MFTYINNSVLCVLCFVYPLVSKLINNFEELEKKIYYRNYDIYTIGPFCKSTIPVYILVRYKFVFKMSAHVNEEKLQQAQMVVEQLRSQSTMTREKVSVSSKSLLNYVQENETDDPLLNPPNDADNPLTTKACIIL